MIQVKKLKIIIIFTKKKKKKKKNKTIFLRLYYFWNFRRQFNRNFLLKILLSLFIFDEKFIEIILKNSLFIASILLIHKVILQRKKSKRLIVIHFIFIFNFQKINILK